MISAPVVSISRLRIGLDGTGVRSLVLLQGCPLRCRYCLNPQTWMNEDALSLTAQELYKRLEVDELYFRATGGGVTFGGGEPASYGAFIREFADQYAADWSINLETSLQVSEENLRLLIPVIDTFIVDIKSTNPEIYRAYTGGNPDRLLVNLSVLEKACPQKVHIRIPQIPGFNEADDCDESEQQMKSRGFQTERFTYIPQPWEQRQGSL